MESQTDPQEEIVNAHNAFRRKESPPAKNMLKMVSPKNIVTGDGRDSDGAPYIVIL